MLLTVSGKIMSDNEVQLEKILPISVKFGGRMTDLKARQLPKAEDPIDVTPSGMTIDSNLEHLPNAFFPIYVIFGGNTIDTKYCALWKKLSGILVT